MTNPRRWTLRVLLPIAVAPLLAAVSSPAAHSATSSGIPEPNAKARAAGITRTHGATPGWSHDGGGPFAGGPGWDPDAGGGGTAPRVPPFVVSGLDVPPSNTTMNWAAYAQAGYRFVFLKASEGTYYVNPNLASQRSGAVSAQFRVGAYHFANPKNSNGATEAEAFVAAGGGWSPGRLPGVLDIEYNPYSGDACYNLSATDMVSWIRAFVTRYRERTGVDAIIYTTTDWWQRCTGNTTAFAESNPLWLARWADAPGSLPAGLTSWLFWQSGNDDPAGVDYNAFHGTLAQLDAYAAAPAVPYTMRLAGQDRMQTAVAISQRQYPASFAGKSGSVYLARSDVLVDAMAAGTLTGGPLLLVPGCDGLPPSVMTEIARLQPSRVVAIGGEGAVCAATLTAAAGGRPTARLGGADRGETARLIAAERQLLTKARTVYLANESDTSPDSIAGGQLTDGPILLVPGTGPAPTPVTDLIRTLAPAQVVALGGMGALSAETLASAAGSTSTGRLGGADRYETAAVISARAVGARSTVAYLASGQVFADAVAGGMLTDGALLLVPQCGDLPSAVGQRLRALAPQSIVPLGGEGAICSDLVAQAAGAAR